MKRSTAPALILVLLPLLVVVRPPVHLDLAESHPAADETLAEPPTNVWLAFTEVPDPERSTFRIQGPDGTVALSDVTPGEDAKVLEAEVEGPMPPGIYTVEWTAAPMDDHAVRGRFDFFVDVSGSRR